MAKTKYIFYLVGRFLFMAGIPCLFFGIFSWFNNDINVAYSFFISFFVLLLLSTPSFFPTKPQKLSRFGLMFTLCLIWILVTIVYALPYMGYGMPPIDALFESMSGITTTGLSVLPDCIGGAECSTHLSTSKSILIWRNYEQFIGGFGIVMLAFILVSGSSSLFNKIYESEVSSEKVSPNAKNSIISIIELYAFFSGIFILLYMLSGLDIYESTNLLFAGISTGGFALYKKSLAYFLEDLAVANLAVIIISIILMIIGGNNFGVMSRFFKGDRRSLFKSEEVRLYFVLNLVFIALLYAVSKNLLTSAFHGISAVTGTGWAIGGFSDAEKYILIIPMILGACSFSTAGGIKQFRVLIILKSFYWYMKSLWSPKGTVFPKKITIMDSKQLSSDDILIVYIFSVLYVVFIIASTMFMLVFYQQELLDQGHGALDCFFESASAIGTVGLSTGITSYAMPDPIKVVFIVLMFLGRLEIFTVFALILYPLKENEII